MRNRAHWGRAARRILTACVLTALLAAIPAAAGVSKGTGFPQRAGKSSEAITITVLDAGGVLSFTKPMFEAFKSANPGLVSEIKYEQAPSTEAVAKIRIQQAAGRLVTDVVVSGGDVVGAGIQNDVWLKLFPNQQRVLSNTKNYTLQAKELTKLADGYAAAIATEYQGPLLNYDPARVQLPARVSPQALLAWAKAHPRRFTYARPPSSGPGRQFLMALPYILGDKNPRDPVKGWKRTWAYLKDLGQYTAPHPASTSETLRGLGQQNYDLVVSTVGWDLGMRAQAIHPLTFKVAPLGTIRSKLAAWTVAGHYMMVPRGMSADRQKTILKLLNFVLTARQQTKMYAAQNKTQPGPAVKGVTLANAPAETKQAIAKTTRPEYATLINQVRTVTELDSETLAVALDRWTREIGR